MIHVSMFWSNVCVFHRYEKEQLNKIINILQSKGIFLEITYFGIGYPERMSTYLAKENAKIPDIIVSTDLEVFEDQRIYKKISKDLYELQSLFSIKKEFVSSNIASNKNLLPFLVIPLVICSKDAMDRNLQSFKAILEEKQVCFGGIENSGTKSVIKAFWDYFGKEKTEIFCRNAILESMPVGAFHQVKKGRVQSAICPSIYSKTADNESLYRYYPEEGAVALPSFISARTTIAITEIETTLKEILNPEICNYFVNEGDLYCPIEGTSQKDFASEYSAKFLYPSQQYLNNVSAEKFDEFFASVLTSSEIKERIQN